MIGNTLEPGVVSNVSSAATLTSGDSSPGTGLLVGPAHLGADEGSAERNRIYGVSDISEARSLFGADSHLTHAVTDALGQGASPILAVVPSYTMEMQDISTISSQSVTLNEPAHSSLEYITITIDSEEKTVHKTLEPLDSQTVTAGTALYNPATDEIKLDASPSSSGTIEYWGMDYQQALNQALSYEGDIDFVGTLKGRTDVTNMLLSTLNQMEQKETLALGIASMPAPVDTSGNITVSQDTSRIQLIEPGYHEDYTSMVGAFVGMRAEIGLSTTPINQRLNLRERPYAALDVDERSLLISARVTPLEAIGRSARVADDITTVSESNTEEQNYRYGFSRLAVDFLTEALHDLEQPYIGKFNSPGAIGQLEDLLNEEARPLEESNVIYEYEATVTMVDPTTAKVLMQADVAEPIRTIRNETVIGNNLTLQNDA